MIFLIILLALNIVNTQTAEPTRYDNMKVKPLQTLATVSLSTTTDNLSSKIAKTRMNNATPNPIKTDENKKSSRDANNNDDYEKLEQLFEKSNEPRQGMVQKLSNKELVDNIFEMILNNKHVDVDCDSYHCSPGYNQEHYKKRFQKNDKFKENYDFHRGENFNYNNNQYENHDKNSYPMKLPLSTLAFETPKDGVLGKFHFRFIPVENTRRRYRRF